jgi:transcriptional regulator with XRE-family HTH domain
MDHEPIPDLERIGATIRDVRERSGERQNATAERAGISARHLRDIELGRERGSRATYLRIATALGIDHDEMDRITGLGVNVT